MVILLMISFSIIIYLKKRGESFDDKYVGPDCDSFYSSYSEHYINDRAIKGWYDFYHPSAT